MNLNIPSVDKERLLAHLDHSNPDTVCLSVCLSVTGSRGGDMNLNIPSIDKERLLAHLDHSNPDTVCLSVCDRISWW